MRIVAAEVVVYAWAIETAFVVVAAVVVTDAVGEEEGLWEMKGMEIMLKVLEMYLEKMLRWWLK